MPFVKIEMLEGRTTEQKEALVEAVTKAVSEIAKTPKDHVWVVIQDSKKENWAIGGVMLSKST